MKLVLCILTEDPSTDYGDCNHGDVRLANYTDNEEMGFSGPCAPKTGVCSNPLNSPLGMHLVCMVPTRL